MGTLSNDVGELRFSDPGVIRANARDPQRPDFAPGPAVRNLGRRRGLIRVSAVAPALAIHSATSDIGSVATT